MRVRRRLIPSIALAILAALPATAAHAADQPMRGVGGPYDAPICGTNDFVRVKTPQTEYATVDTAGTCVSSEKTRPDFTITSVTKNLLYQMPVVVSGYVPTGESTCASSRDTCFAYPVRQEYDGEPVASFGAWLAPGDYSLAFDTWFSPVESRHSYANRKGDTEVMVWLSEPGGDWPADFNGGYAEIDGMRFGIMSWEQPAGVRYVAYVDQTGPGAKRTDLARSGQHVVYGNLWLNPFWRNAISHGWMNKTEWLWSIALGFELRPAVAAGNGKGDDITDNSLKDVR